MKLKLQLLIPIILTLVISSFPARYSQPASGDTSNNVFDVRANLPQKTNGENGVRLQFRAVNGTYVDLPYQYDYIFGKWLSQGGKYLVPAVSGHYPPYGTPNPNAPLSTDMILAHPLSVNPDGLDLDTIIRVDIPGEGGQVRVTGSAGKDGGTVLFYIYKGATQYKNPLWSANGGGTFNFTVSYTKGDQIFFADNCIENGYDDWGWWKSLKLTTSAVELTTGSLKITVKDSAGAVISGASVSTTNQPSGQTALNGITGTDGIVVFNDVKLGSYSVQVTKSGYVTASGSGSVSVGATGNVSIVLQAQQSASGGIPGYPFESVLIGLILVVMIVIYRSRTN